MLDTARPPLPPHDDVPAELWRKYLDLRARLAALPRIVVAYSGGVDSAFVLAVAREVRGEGVLAFTARSPSLMAVELEEAVVVAQVDPKGACGSMRGEAGDRHAEQPQVPRAPPHQRLGQRDGGERIVGRQRQ
jgi:hypothetical protein